MMSLDRPWDCEIPDFHLPLLSRVRVSMTRARFELRTRVSIPLWQVLLVVIVVALVLGLLIGLVTVDQVYG